MKCLSAKNFSICPCGKNACPTKIFHPHEVPVRQKFLLFSSLSCKSSKICPQEEKKSYHAWTKAEEKKGFEFMTWNSIKENVDIMKLLLL